MSTIIYPSEEYIEEAKKKLNESELYSDAASDWEKTVLFVMKADPEEGLDEDVYIWWDLYQGECREVKMLDSIDEEDSDYVFEGEFSVWKRIQKGEVSANEALLQGALDIRGDMSYLMQRMDAANGFTDVVTNIEVEFP